MKSRWGCVVLETQHIRHLQYSTVKNNKSLCLPVCAFRRSIHTTFRNTEKEITNSINVQFIIPLVKEHTFSTFRRNKRLLKIRAEYISMQYRHQGKFSKQNIRTWILKIFKNQLIRVLQWNSSLLKSSCYITLINQTNSIKQTETFVRRLMQFVTKSATVKPISESA